MSAVIDNKKRNRYELRIGDDIAFADYRIENNVMFFVHTLVPKALEGRGVGSKLAQGALTDAQKRGFKIMPRCSFIERYLIKHPELAD